MPLKLVGVDGKLHPQTYGLVDSGADRCDLPFAWAAALGIDVKKDCQEITGNTAGGPMKKYMYDKGLDMIVMGKKLHLPVVFFSPGLPLILLGREDFFAAYKVSFDQRKQTFTVEPY